MVNVSDVCMLNVSLFVVCWFLEAQCDNLFFFLFVMLLEFILIAFKTQFQHFSIK